MRELATRPDQSKEGAPDATLFNPRTSRRNRTVWSG